MENNKDSYKGHPSNDTSNIKNSSFFNNDEYSVFLYRKTEKLVAAVYMVTSLFDQGEPLKQHLRDAGLCLLSDVTALANTNSTDRDFLTTEVAGVILKILSMLEVAFYSGSLSDMNHRILRQEYLATLEVIEKKERYEKEKNGFILADNFFKTEEKYIVPDLHKPSEQGQSSPASSYASSPSSAATGAHQSSGGAQHGPTPQKPIKSHGKDVVERKDSRKAIILNLLKKENDLTIKDFRKVIPDCSEKTIQRELLQMVEEGILIKIGERRWSRYSINRANRAQ